MNVVDQSGDQLVVCLHLALGRGDGIERSLGVGSPRAQVPDVRRDEVLVRALLGSLLPTTLGELVPLGPTATATLSCYSVMS